MNSSVLAKNVFIGLKVGFVRQKSKPVNPSVQVDVCAKFEYISSKYCVNENGLDNLENIDFNKYLVQP